MTVRVDWIGLAEGAAGDLGGKLTLVGFNPHNLTVSVFPATLAPTFVICLEDDEYPSSTLDSVRAMNQSLTVSGPDDAILFYADVPGQVPNPVRRFKSVPPRLMITFQAGFTASRAGKYKFSVRIELLGEDATVIEASKSFWVINPDDDALDIMGPGYAY